MVWYSSSDTNICRRKNQRSFQFDLILLFCEGHEENKHKQWAGARIFWGHTRNRGQTDRQTEVYVDVLCN